MYKLKTEEGSKNGFCHACLSIGRKLSPLGKYSDIFTRICLNRNEIKSQMLICWECVAILKKTTRFIRNVENVQKILIPSIYKETKQKSFSCLQIVHNKPDYIINVAHEETECKVIHNIKQELNQNIDNYDINEQTDNFDDDFLTDNVKKEIPSPEFKIEDCDIKKTKKNRIKPKLYKYVYENIIKEDLERLTKKIPIELKEIEYWLERERNSAIYVNAMYKCERCACSWKTEKPLVEHNRKYHSLTSGTYMCDICTCRFPTKKQLTRHLPRHMCIRECSTCRHRSCVVRHMRRHLAEHTKRLQCAVCGSVQQLAEHTRRLQGAVCGSVHFSTMRQLRRHHRDLHAVFACDHCPKRCKSKYMLEKHMRRHFETYECKTCDRRYKTRATYRKHCDNKHAAATEAAYCVPCDKQFASALLYRRHVATSGAHAAERDTHRTASKVPCPSCGRTYSRKTYMMNHYRHVHMRQSNYYCTRCDRHFLNRTRYVDHMRYKHEGVKKEKNKLCNICGRGFAANRTLVNHIRTHLGERPYECTHCGGTFTQKHAMLSHMRHVHLDSKRAC